jgi:hypothetical protein
VSEESEESEKSRINLPGLLLVPELFVEGRPVRFWAFFEDSEK